MPKFVVTDADGRTTSKITLDAGSSIVIPVRFKQSDGATSRDVSAATAVCRVYLSGKTGALLFPEKTLDPGATIYEKTLSLTTTDLATRADSLHVEIALTDAGDVDIYTGVLRIE